MKLNQTITKFCQILLLLVISTSAFSKGMLPEIKDYWLRAAPPNSMMQAAYGKLINNTNQEIKLIGAYSPAFKMTEIHKTIITDGVARMKHQPELIIEDKQTLAFEPGGLHIMLMHPIIKFKAGDKIKINLIYQIDGEKVVDEIWFPVIKK